MRGACPHCGVCYEVVERLPGVVLAAHCVYDCRACRRRFRAEGQLAVFDIARDVELYPIGSVSERSLLLFTAPLAMLG